PRHEGSDVLSGHPIHHAVIREDGPERSEDRDDTVVRGDVPIPTDRVRSRIDAEGLRALLVAQHRSAVFDDQWVISILDREPTPVSIKDIFHLLRPGTGRKADEPGHRPAYCLKGVDRTPTNFGRTVLKQLDEPGHRSVGPLLRKGGNFIERFYPGF